MTKEATLIAHRAILRPVRHRLTAIIAVTLSALCVIAVIAWFTCRHIAEQRIRQRIISTLSGRLHATVTLDPVHLMFQRGFRIEATNIRAVAQGTPPGTPPIFTLALLHARVPILNFFFQRANDTHVAAHGMVLDLSEASRQQLTQAAAQQGPQGLPLERLVVTDSTLRLEPSLPGKPAVIIRCDRLVLDDLDDPRSPAAYTADLAGPIPGLHSEGHFGPLDLASPRDTPIDGTFRIQSAPLTLIHGIEGTAFVSGRLQGTLGQTSITGSGTSPDFAFSTSRHPVAIAGDFHALFDLTTGDIALPQVSAHFLHTVVQATGTIDRRSDGRHIALALHIPSGRNEELIDLLSRSGAPFSSGLTLQATLSIPPGSAPLIQRARAQGRASLTGLRWIDPAIQSRMNSLSMRASDHADQGEDHPGTIPAVAASLAGDFTLGAASLHLNHLVYTMPGAVILMDGRFPLTSPDLEFHGLARTVATASHMETGLKSLLLKPISPLLKKNGAGMQIPVSLTGLKTNPTLALDFTHLSHEKALSRQNANVPRR